MVNLRMTEGALSLVWQNKMQNKELNNIDILSEKRQHNLKFSSDILHLRYKYSKKSFI